MKYIILFLWVCSCGIMCNGQYPVTKNYPGDTAMIKVGDTSWMNGTPFVLKSTGSDKLNLYWMQVDTFTSKPLKIIPANNKSYAVAGTNPEVYSDTHVIPEEIKVVIKNKIDTMEQKEPHICQEQSFIINGVRTLKMPKTVPINEFMRKFKVGEGYTFEIYLGNNHYCDLTQRLPDGTWLLGDHPVLALEELYQYYIQLQKEFMDYKNKHK